MKKILINGINAKSGGGKSILINYLKLLQNEKSDLYYFTSPNDEEFKKFQASNIKLIKLNSIFKNQFLLIFTYYFLLKILIKIKNIDIVFNQGDLIIPTNIKQYYLFDWPYAIYPESIVWKKMTVKSKMVRKIKLYFFKKEIHKPNKILCQTKTAKKRLENLYFSNNILVIPNAVSLDNLKKENFSFKFKKIHKKNYNMLYLTYYYPHKNLEILLDVAEKIKKQNLSIKIYITISNEQGHGAKKILKHIRNNSLEKILVNLGPIPMEKVPSLYNQCDALIMPTLLESFSGTYVEAMFHSKTIFTSGYDFAKDVCGNSAFYFDPLNSDNIFEIIKKNYMNPDKQKELHDNGIKRLKQMNDWNKTFNEYQKVIKNG